MTGKAFSRISPCWPTPRLDENGEEQGGMGAAVCDVDGDLDLDIAVANYQDEYNILYRNDGHLQFTDASFVSGMAQVTRPYVSFGLLLEDFNNDSWNDMFVATGHVYPITDQLLDIFLGYAQNSLMFHNLGKASSKHIRLFGRLLEERLPKAPPISGRRPDIIVNNLTHALFLENQSPGGTARTADSDEGACLPWRARPGERRIRRKCGTLFSASFLSQNSAALHFGLGKTHKSAFRSAGRTARNGIQDIPINRQAIVRKTAEWNADDP